MESTKLTYDINKRLSYHTGINVLSTTEDIGVSKEQLNHFCEKTTVSPESIFYDEKRYPSFYCYDFPVYFDIVDLNEDENHLVVFESIKRRVETCRNLFKAGHLERYFQLVQGACSKDILVRVFLEYKDQLTYQQLRRFYISQFHGHVQASDNMMRHALSLRPKSYTPPLPNDQHTYKVYRGAGKHSHPIKENWFWTLDLMVAGKDAAAATDDPVIYEGTVHKDNIIDYFPKHGRSEIVVAPENIEKLQPINQKDSLEFSVEMKQCRLADEFNFYRHTFIKPRQYACESDLHGTAHTTRVLLFALALSHLENFDDRCRAIVANAAIYHAIGREETLTKRLVGEASLAQLKRLHYPLFIINCTNAPLNKKYCTDSFTKDEIQLIHRLIANHSKPSDEALAASELSQLPSHRIECYKELFNLLKHAHDLDGIREDSLDQTVIEHASTKSLIAYAIRSYHILEDL